jgi:diaminopimelate epimerase
VRFAKAHGLGNDFVLVEDRDVPADFSPWARRLCDRHRGVGADGVLRFRLDGPDVQMRLINADGGEVELSGNGVRCLAAYVHYKGWLPERHTVRTPSGPRPVIVERTGEARFRIETELGAPLLRSDQIPCALDPPRGPVLDHALDVAGERVLVTAVSMGNPHCSVFTDAVADDALVGRLGPALETHAFFPKRTNVELVTVVSPSELRVRFWERGVGPTQASGTGSAGAFVAAVLKGLVERRVRVVCDGGTLEMEWPEGGGVGQTGDVEVLFEGDWLQ